MKRLILVLALMLTALCSRALAQTEPTLVFVKVPEFVLPIAREEKYEDPLDDALAKARLGTVTGSGPQLAPDGSLGWVGLDVELTDVSRGIPFLKKKLMELGAPRGSTLQFEQSGRKVEMPVHE